MTDHKPTNPLMGQARSFGSAPTFVSLKDSGEQVPTEIHAYCGWLNAKEQRRGMWAVITIGGPGNEKKTVEFRAEIASDAWLREKGMSPAVGKAA